MSSLHVRSVLKSIDNISKLLFLSSFKSTSRPEVLPTWRSLTFWNLWTLTGFFVHTSFHLIYVSQNDKADSRPKLVTVFIDIYNKYCGLLLNCTLVLAGYFQQANIANINLLFGEIEDLFLKQMKIKIKNLNTLRWARKVGIWWSSPRLNLWYLTGDVAEIVNDVKGRVLKWNLTFIKSSTTLLLNRNFDDIIHKHAPNSALNWLSNFQIRLYSSHHHIWRHHLHRIHQLPHVYRTDLCVFRQLVHCRLYHSDADDSYGWVSFVRILSIDEGALESHQPIDWFL